MNIFTCTTRLYKDAEQRFSQSGDSIVSFKGAVDSGYGQNKTTTWIKFTMFGKRGESVLPYLKDKTQIAVSGELANREYTDREGQKRYSLEVRVNDLTLLGGKQEGQQSQPARQAQKPAANDLGDDVPW
jgi:single-strand DNA-binding protein